MTSRLLRVLIYVLTALYDCWSAITCRVRARGEGDE